MTLFQLAPKFLSGSSTSPVLQPAHGFHSKPMPMPMRLLLRTQRTTTNEQDRRYAIPTLINTLFSAELSVAENHTQRHYKQLTD
jgi:hypothetical protein